MTTKPKLGRGLGALIKDEFPLPQIQPKETAKEETQKIPIALISRNPFQPRRNFEPNSLAELSQSISKHGVLQPLLVRQVQNGYELIAGERRLRAASEAGIKEVPVIVVQADDSSSLQLALVENLQRENLNILEEAEGYRLLIDKFGMTQEQVAEKVGKGRATVANALRILSLPDEVKAMISSGAISAGHAKLIAGLSSPTEQKQLARLIVEGNLSVRQTEKKIKQTSKTKRQTKKISGEEIPQSHIHWLLDKLHAHFGTSVHIIPCKTLPNGKKARGQLIIDFYSKEDLDRILELLGINLE